MHISNFVYILGGLVFATQVAVGAGPGDLDFFESKIRPLLAEACYECHSQKAKKLKGDLYLDHIDLMKRGGDTGPAVVPGHPDKSLLIEAVRYGNPDLQMPPKRRLSPEQSALLEDWVKRGAPWPEEPEPTGSHKLGPKHFDLAQRKAEHWSWQPVRNPKPPKAGLSSWARRDLDYFVQQKRVEKKLDHAPDADRRTLIRRAYFAVTGLPPSPEQVRAFVSDTSEKAFEKVIDGLLASPHFGERWARHWMDLVRYAESRGHEFDYSAPNAWRYRDYLIRAFNADLPYNQFVTEHLAGDLLPRPRLNPETGFNESILATGYWFLGEWIHSPVDIRQDEADRFDNMIDVTAKSFLGLTLACARCHDHMFDAISSKDYYSFAAFLQSSGYRQVRYETMVQNGYVARELRDLRAKHRPAIVAETGRVFSAAPVEAYLLCAAEVLQQAAGAAVPVPVKASGSGELFEDFEMGTYDNWKVEGTAFGDGPVTLKTIADYQKDVRPQGTYFVNSHNVRKGKGVGAGDQDTGKLISPEFEIRHAYMTFLVGGGSHKDQTCINLYVGGKRVYSTTGKSSNTMHPDSWDLRKFSGRRARIEIVDNHRGGWGNIGADAFRFTNVLKNPGQAREPAKGSATRLRADQRAAIERIAGAEGWDAAVLQAWAVALMASGKDASSPLHAVHMAMQGKRVSPGAPADRGLLKQAEIMVDYGDIPPEAFIQDGYAWGPSAVKAGQVSLGRPGQPIRRIAPYGAAVRDPAWNGLKIIDSEKDAGSGLGKYSRSGQTLRTPTFEVKNKEIFYLVKGNGSCLVVVDSHRMVQGPLHRSVVKHKMNADGKMRWISHGQLDKYVGHRVHLEFTPEGDQPFEVLVVAQPGPDNNRDFLKYLPGLAYPGLDADTLALAARAFAGHCGTAARLDASRDASFLSLATWMGDHPDLFGLGQHTWSAGAQAFWKKQDDLIGSIVKESRVAMAMLDGSAEGEYVFLRGSYKKKGDRVDRRFLEALKGRENPVPTTGSGRLELARQMTDPANPYISRVIVNRLWHHLMGRGIVPTTDDFGVLGQRPSHPELLDHLASRFLQNGWSIKGMLKEIMLSRTYQMASRAEGPEESLDPQNVYLHRMSVKRLEGEVLRDSILAVSGSLNLKLYGKSVGVHLTSFMTGRGRPGSGPLDGSGRRSVYVSVRRNFLSPMMLAFDTPSPFSSVGRRTVSNVPSQALILMNDPFVLEQARKWADRVVKTPGSLEDRVRGMYERALAREPSALELAKAVAFLEAQGKPENDVAMWQDFAHVLFNVKEFIYIN
jgi:hypothetical protein